MQSVLDFFLKANRLVVAAHERPDGDALGSALALKRLLYAQGVDAVCVGLEPVPPRYTFLVRPGEVTVAGKGWSAVADGLVVLDCGGFDRVGPFAAEAKGRLPIVNIDHHDQNTQFGTVNWVDPTASSVGEMIYRLARDAGWDIDTPVAEALWTAIVTDTGRFSYENTSARVMKIGADLLACGVDPARLHREIYESATRQEMRLTARAIDSLQCYAGGRLSTVSLSRGDFRELRCTPQNAQDVVNIARGIQGVEVGVFLYELLDQDETKVSVRSLPPHDAAAFCRTFGGGGHHRAAGCAVPGRLRDVMPRVVEAASAFWFSSDTP